MGTGSSSPVRALRAAAMLALAAAACAACGSSSSKPVPISVAEATQNPCLLVSLSQATAILGSGATEGSKEVAAGVYSECTYGNDSTAVSVALEFGPIGEAASLQMMKNSAPVTVAGHAGLCGAETSKYGGGGFAFAAPIKSGVWLSVDGAPSCAVDDKFAQAVYANL